MVTGPGRASPRGGRGRAAALPRLLLLSAAVVAALLLVVLLPFPAAAVPHHRINRFRMRARDASASPAASLSPSPSAATLAASLDDALLAGFTTPAAASPDALRAIADLKLRMARGVGSAAPITSATTVDDDDDADADDDADDDAASAASSSTGGSASVSSMMHEDDVETQQRATLAAGANAGVQVNQSVPHNVTLFFPAECSASGRTCCPLYLGHVCGGSTRGSCQLITQSATCTVGSWIADVFDYGCVCEGNRDGIACESCLAGYTGANCTEVTAVLMRRNFASLATDEQEAIIEAFQLAKITPHPFHAGISAYDWLVAYHQWAQAGYAPWSKSSDAKYAFWQGPGAPTWHRQYQLLVDHTFRLVTGNDKFIMPYWNWAVSTGTNMDLTLAAFGGDGDPLSGYVSRDGEWYRCRAVDDASLSDPSGCNCTVTEGPFADWRVLGAWGEPIEGGTRVLTRSFACMEASLPTLDVVMSVTSQERFSYFDAHGAVVTNATLDSFLVLMAGIGRTPQAYSSWPPSLASSDMNSRVYRWVGGTMMSDSAASDPLFFLHLAFTDGLFESWIRKQIDAGTFSVDDNGLATDGAASGQNADDCVAPHYPLHAHRDYFETTLALGYDYDFLDLEADETMFDQWWL